MPEIRSGKIGPDHQLTYRKKSPLNLLIWIAAVIVVAVAIGWLLTHMGKPAAGPGGPGGPGGGRRGGGGFGGRAAITVGTAPVTIGNIPIQLDALGTVTPPVTAVVASRIAGNLMEIYFKEGQMVKKGQKLALIDPRPYRVALEQAQGTLARDQAALADAQLDLQRYQTLLSQNSIAKQTVDTQAALVKQDAGVVQTDKAGVDSAKLNLTYTLITAPAAGRVGLRQVDIGNYIPVGSTTGIVVLTQVDPIDVEFTIPEDNVPAITKRQRANATLPVTVFDRGGGVTLATGQLSTLDNQIDTSTGTVKAKARFNNSNGALFPNQFVNARLLVDVLCNAVIVPTTAVRHGSQGDFVYTLNAADKTAKLVIVKTGPGTPETVSIVSGLTGNETVITEGGDRLRDGAKVNLPGDRPQGGFGSGGRRGRRGAGGASGAPGGARAAQPRAASKAARPAQAKPAQVRAAASPAAPAAPAASSGAADAAGPAARTGARPRSRTSTSRSRAPMCRASTTPPCPPRRFRRAPAPAARARAAEAKAAPAATDMAALGAALAAALAAVKASRPKAASPANPARATADAGSAKARVRVRVRAPATANRAKVKAKAARARGAGSARAAGKARARRRARLQLSHGSAFGDHPGV